jgi:hypothetical protein
MRIFLPSSVCKYRQINDPLCYPQGNVSRLKASEFSIGIPHTEPGDIEIDQISTTSSSGRNFGEKDVMSIA